MTGLTTGGGDSTAERSVSAAESKGTGDSELPQSHLAAWQLAEAAWRRNERDRRYVVDALHDNVVQALLALSWQLDDLAGNHPVQLQAQLDRVVADMWSLIGTLQPAQSPTGDLAEAITQQLAAMTHGDRLRAELELDCGTLDADTELPLQRICAETLRNCAQHADPTVVRVRCRRRADGRTVLHVTDDGAGCDPAVLSAALHAGRYGLRRVTWAVASRGGRIRLLTRPGRGFGVHVMLAPAPRRQG